VPAANCGDVADLETDLTLVEVGTLRDAIEALQTLQQPDGATRVPQC
jgi:PDZ domain-containing protein